MDIIIQKGGHYQKLSSLNSEKAEIIKIIGPDTNIRDYWKTSDGSSISEYALIHDYVLLEMSPNQDAHNREMQKKKNLFADFEPILDNSSTNNEQNEPEKYESSVELEKFQQPNTNKIVENTAKQNIKQQSEYDLILDKLNIDKINQLNFDKYGIETKIQKPKILLQVPIEFDFDIVKLRQTINLLNLNTTTLVNQILETMNINYDLLVTQQLLYHLNNEDSNVIQPEPKIIEQIVEKPPIIVTINKNKLEKKKRQLTIYDKGYQPTDTIDTTKLPNGKVEKDNIEKIDETNDNFFKNTIEIDNMLEAISQKYN